MRGTQYRVLFLRGSPRKICHTGYSPEGHGRDFRDSGFERALTKPADPALLHQLLNGAGSSAS
jgi:hypothetical protein